MHCDHFEGIGYFTLPFLVYGHARHVYACEWNPDSMEALRRNLQANHIDEDRYTLLLGDNREVKWTLFFAEFHFTMIIIFRHVRLVLLIVVILA